MSPLLVIFAAAFGAASAAFLPRLAHRLAVGYADEPRSACAVCSRPFNPGISGWVRVGAPCSCSGGYAWTVLSGATAGGALAVVIGPSPLLPAYLVAVVPGVLLAAIDLRCLRLPDRLVGLVAVTAVPLAVLRPARIGPALVAAGAVLTAYAILAGLGGLGLGDLKLAAVLALILGFAGWPAVIAGVLAPHLINGPIALFLLVTRRRTVLPFGPALLAGALIGLTAA
ncbi:prepilin peptidase [Paractinoplanes rhizophilus]|uniref:Prepilin peptidase n=1 Tax=Paractinoplanes rhizophilus TaxID=1416877 RepID=A0ABW2HVK6_9ACTN|nr:prepilin peptidase [Actinoplanes sp.]